MIILLDTSIITLLITNPEDSQEAKKCQEWFYSLLSKGIVFNIPEVCDYEVRRGILLIQEKTRRNQFYKLNELEILRETVEYISFTETTSRMAAIFWAKATAMGKTQPKGISADILILAHAKLKQEEYPGRQIIIATKNIKDFSIFPKSYIDIYVNDWSLINF